MDDVVQNPVWCLHDKHVHDFLQLIVDYWSDFWGVERIDLPEPHSEQNDYTSVMHRRLLRLRHLRLEQAGLSADFGRGDYNTDVKSSFWAERRMWAAVLRKSVYDWTKHLCNPVRYQQRKALNCYWWFMGYPVLKPQSLSDEAIKDIRLGRTRKYKLQHFHNPFRECGIDIEDLWSSRLTQMDFFPWEEEESMVEYEAIGSFETVCHVLGIDADDFRKRVHLVSHLS